MGKKSYLDLLHDIEVGDNKSLLTDFVEIPKKSATKRELADEIMQSISTPSEKTSYNSYEVSSDDFSIVESEYIDDEDDDDADEDSSNFIANFINDKTKKKKKKKNNDLSYDKITSQKSQSAKDIPQIKISYSDVSGRIIIDDEVAPVSVNVVNIMDFEDVCPFDFDSDTIIDFLADVYKFIIASKYPSVIMTKEEFEVNLGILEKIDLNQFMFFSIDDYILGYYVDPNSSKNFVRLGQIDLQLQTVVHAKKYMMLFATGSQPQNHPDGRPKEMILSMRLLTLLALVHILWNFELQAGATG